MTGAPGHGQEHAGGSSGGRIIARRDQTVGIIAVDPTSPYTGGAILGDRIRMQGHAGDAGVFIRSMATRGFLGGLARATADVALLLDAAGKQIVLIETVGVGQDEIDIVRLADCTLVLLVPGMGDDVQSMKAGLMEVADIFVLNKAEREGADRLEQQIAAMLELAPEQRRLEAADRAHDGDRRRGNRRSWPRRSRSFRAQRGSQRRPARAGGRALEAAAARAARRASCWSALVGPERRRARAGITGRAKWPNAEEPL